jgi:hypothetical protein
VGLASARRLRPSRDEWVQVLHMMVLGSKGVVQVTGVDREYSRAWLASMMRQGYETLGVVKQRISGAPGASRVVKTYSGCVLLGLVVYPVVSELRAVV